MSNWTFAFISILALVIGGEYAKYNFAQDIGEIFPDRSGNGFDGTNGTSHLDTNYNMLQQINRGLYNDGTWPSYAVCPAETLNSQTISLNSTSANYSVAIFLNVGSYDGSHGQFAQIMAICSSGSISDGYTNWYDAQFGYGLQTWYMNCARDASQDAFLSWGDLAKPILTGWQFMNWVVWYDIDRPKYEWFINGVSQGVASDVVGGFVHVGEAPRFRFGSGFKGFISHAIIMTPGDSTMSNYFASGTNNCSPLSVCMIDPQTVIPGDCWDITYVSDCSVNWSCVSGTQWNFTVSDCDPCAACPSECSSCQYDYASADYQCLLLHSSLVIRQDAGAYTCSCVASDYYFYADATQFPANYWLPCNSDCATCSEGTDLDWIICADGKFKQPAPDITCQSTCPEYYYGDTTSKVCTGCHPSCRTCNGTAANLCTLCSDSNSSVTGSVSAWTCNDGQYDSDATDGVSCQQWNEDCLTCDGGTESDCLVCASGKFRQPAENPPYSCQSTCPDTFYADSADNTWKACDSTWDTCIGPNANNCTSCDDQNASVTGTESAWTCNSGWGDVAGSGLNCQPCDQRCNGWTAGSDHTSWIACSAGFFLQPNGSATCDSEWQDGYVQNSVDQTCEPCHPSWSTCDGTAANQCSACDDSNAQVDTGICTWISGFYDSDATDDVNCQQCHSNWETWIGNSINQCISWANSNSSLDAATGIWLCNARFYDIIAGDLVDCQPCYTTCGSCTGDGSNECNDCADSNASVIAGSCQWNTGYHDSDQGDGQTWEFITCATEWATCYGSTQHECNTWKVGYLQQTGTNSWHDTCPSGYFENGTNCDQCFETCETCSGANKEDWNTCSDQNATSDNPGEWLCNDGFFDSDTSSNVIWDSWLSKCETCVIEFANWLTCASNFYKDPNFNACEETCPQNYFGNDSSNAWEPCHSTCDGWYSSSANDCQSCNIDNTYTNDPGPCQCIVGMFDSDSGEDINWVCTAVECEIWDGDTNDDCSLWKDGFFKQPPSSTSTSCRVVCPDQSYPDGREWLDCHASWLTCDQSGADSCTSCVDANADILVSLGEWRCKSGYYDALSGSDSMDCQEWDIACDEWTGGTQDNCNGCNTGYFLLPPITASTQCRETCPDNHMEDGSVCRQWFSAWKTCTGLTKDDWTTCMDANATIGSPTEWTCVAGYYDSDSTDGVFWVTWDSACASCDGPGHTHCIAWASSYYLIPPVDTSTNWSSEWPDYYFGNDVSNQWDPWNSTWKTCSGPNMNDWITWHDSNASIDATGICLWNSGYYDSDVMLDILCIACTGQCATCVNTGANCLSWSVDYFLQPQASNLCLDTCPERYFADTSNQTCQLCQEDCATWLEAMPYRCITCTDSNTFISITGNCQWSYGYYVVGKHPLQWVDSCPNGTVSYSSQWVETCPAGTYQDSTECIQCHQDWNQCSGGLRSNWLECSHQNKQITEGECHCIPGFYADPGDATNCLGCGPDCLTCSDGTTCQTCKALHAIPVNGICECAHPFLASNDITSPLEWLGCPKTSQYNIITAVCELEWQPGEFPADFEWKLCSENCTQWQNNVHCVRCSDGYYENNQFICASWNQICKTCQEYETNCTSCRDNFVLNGNSWTCPEPQILQNTTWIDPIRVSIDANNNNVIALQFSDELDQILTKDDLQISIYTPDGQKIEFTYTLQKLKNDEYEISITPTTDNISQESIFSIEFSEDYKSKEPISPIDYNLNTQLHEQDSEQTEDEQKRRQEVSDSTSTGSMAILSASAFLASTSYNFGALWRIINYLQLVSLFAFFNMSTTPELDGFLSSCLKDSSMPNIYDFILPEDYETLYLPSRFQKSNYGYPLLLDTFGHSLTIWLAITVVLGLAWIAANSSIGCLSKIGNKVQDLLVYNGLIRTVLETSIYIFIGSFLTFKFGFAYEIHSLINTTLSGLAMLLLLAFSVKWFTAIKTKNGQLGDEQKKYKDLTKELKENTNNFSAYFNVIFLLRRAAFCSVVVFIEGPKVQIFISAFLNISHLTWLICACPFDSMMINCIEIYCELIIVITNLFMLVFLTDYEEINTISTVIIVLIITAIFSYFLLIIRSILVKRCKRSSKIDNENTEETETEGNLNRDRSISDVSDRRSKTHKILKDNKLDFSKNVNKGDMNEDQQRLPRKTFAF